VAGELGPGDRVPQEDVAERIGVSLIPVREALRVLESEGQVTYFPRRGYFVTELHIEDLVEIYALREILEDRAARHATAALDDDAIERMEQAARDCTEAAGAADIARELAANRRFHLGLFECAGEPHAMRLIRLLWESTEPYRALYDNLPVEREAADAAHQRILGAARRPAGPPARRPAGATPIAWSPSSTRTATGRSRRCAPSSRGRRSAPTRRTDGPAGSRQDRLAQRRGRALVARRRRGQPDRVADDRHERPVLARHLDDGLQPRPPRGR
jgi:DNA-binding GntR family transcriptional regulator